MANQISTSTSSSATQPANNTLVQIASDGTALVIWFDGTNQKFSYASSPYSSWTTGTLTTGSRFAAATLLDTSDNVAAATSTTGGPITYYPLTKSGATYTLGSGTQISSNTSTFNAGNPSMFVKDTQGRYWSISNNNNNTICQVYESGTPTTANWTSSLSATAANNPLLPAADIVGNYLVAIYDTAATTFKYQRIDISGASLGSWSAAATITVDAFADNTSSWSFRGNGAGVGILAYNAGGIKAQTYTASTDTWSSVTTLSTGGSDTEPNVVKVGSDIYCFWCQNAGANNYALVYKKWTASSSTWDTSATTLIASGTNIQYPNAGASSGTIGVVYTIGTTTPWSVTFATVALTTTTIYSFTDALSTSDIGNLQRETVEALTGSDIGNLNRWSVDAGTTSDLGNLQQWTVDLLAMGDIASVQLGAVDVLTAADTQLNTGIPTISDSVSVTDVAQSTVSTIPTDTLSISEILAITLGLSTTEHPPVIDSLAGGGGVYTAIEGLTGNDITINTAQPTLPDALTITDVANVQQGQIEALAIVDTLIGADTGSFSEQNSSSEVLTTNGNANVVESLSTSDTLTRAEAYSPGESLTVSDVQGTQSGTIEALSGIDALTVSDTLTFTDPLTVIDSLTTYDTAAPLDGLTANSAVNSTDALNATDPLAIADSMVPSNAPAFTDLLVSADSSTTSDTYNPIEASSVLESLTHTKSATWIEIDPLADAFSSVEEGPGLTYLFTDQLITSETFAVGLQATINEAGSVIDLLLAGSTTSATDGLQSSDTAAWGAVAALLETLGISQSFASGGMSTPINLLVTSDVASFDQWPLESLALADRLLANSLASIAPALSVSDITSFAVQMATIDAQPLIDMATLERLYAIVGTLILQSANSAMDTAQWQEILSLSDAFTVPLTVVIPSATTTYATGRDGAITASGRDGNTPAWGRDGAVTAGGRG